MGKVRVKAHEDWHCNGVMLCSDLVCIKDGIPRFESTSRRGQAMYYAYGRHPPVCVAYLQQLHLDIPDLSNIRLFLQSSHEEVHKLSNIII